MNKPRLLPLILIGLYALVCIGCESLNRGADYYRARVESNTVAFTIDGVTKQLALGVTTVYRRPGEDPITIKVTEVPASPVAGNSAVNSSGK